MPKAMFDAFNLLPYFKEKYRILSIGDQYCFYPINGDNIEHYGEDFNATYKKAFRENACFTFTLSKNEESAQACKSYYKDIVDDCDNGSMLVAYECGEHEYMEDEIRVREAVVEDAEAQTRLENALYVIHKMNW